jgi:ABC-type uncharacterized transport system substrate-binding protein
MQVRTLVFGLIVFITAFQSANAQQTAKIPRIGYLSGSTASASGSLLDGFRQGLRDHGYAEGKNILVEYRYADGKVDRIPGLVAELVQLNVDAIVTTNFTAIGAAKKATKTIPVVMVTDSGSCRGRHYREFASAGWKHNGTDPAHL